MSAFIVSKIDIDILVTAIARLKPAGRSLIDLNKLGRMLWRENVASVAHRYSHKPREELLEAFGDTEEVENYRFKPTRVRPAAVAKVAACYDYQTCEHPAYEASQARQIYLEIAKAYPDTLPGYDDMPWGISHPDDLAKARPAKRVSAR
jgi:hypothetical protein